MQTYCEIGAATGAIGDKGDGGLGGASEAQAAPPDDGGAAGAAEAAAGTVGTAPLFKKDDIVIVSFGRGNNDFNKKRAKIESALTKHCWVIFEEGPAAGARKKIGLDSLKLAVAPTVVAEAAATGAEKPLPVAVAAGADDDGEPVTIQDEMSDANSGGWSDPTSVF